MTPPTPTFYRSKVLIIEASRVTGENFREVAKWCGGTPVEGPFATWIEILALGRTEIAGVGDWVIKGDDGEFYPCEDSIFQQTYEVDP